MLFFASAFLFVSILGAPVDEEEFAMVPVRLKIAALKGSFTESSAFASV